MARFLIDTILGSATAPSTTLTAATIASGDSLTIKQAKECYLTGVIAKHQTAGFVRVRSSRMHDSTNGILVKTVAALPQDYLQYGKQTLSPQDTIELHISGSGTAGDIEIAALRVVYVDPDTPNAANLIGPAELAARGTGLIACVSASLTAATTAATYGGTIALNNSSNSYALRGNTNYALVGMLTDTTQCVITVKGPDTGFTRVPIPGNASYKFMTAGYCIEESYKNKMPMIPVINTANAGSTVIETVNDENAATVVVQLIFEQLKD